MKGPRPKPPEIRFWAKVKKTNGCWLWTASTKGIEGKNYGQFHDGKRLVSAHRYSWELHHKRKVPRGMWVCHRCDIRICVRPDHLFLGTALDNYYDMRSKGRERHACGEDQFLSKLNEDAVLEIRRRYVPYKVGLTKTLAHKFGVDSRTILAVISGRTWTHVCAN